MFMASNIVMVSCTCIYFQTHQALFIKYTHLFVCQSYLNKVVWTQQNIYLFLFWFLLWYAWELCYIVNIWGFSGNVWFLIVIWKNTLCDLNSLKIYWCFYYGPEYHLSWWMLCVHLEEVYYYLLSGVFYKGQSGLFSS